MHVYYWAEQHDNISKEIARIVFQLSQQNVNSLPPQTCPQTDEPWQSSLPHRPALSRNALTRGIIFSQYYKQQKKKENTATTKQLSPRGLATDTAVSQLQWRQGFTCHFQVHTRKSRILCTGYMLSLHSSYHCRNLSRLHLIHLRIHATFSWAFRHIQV